MKKFFKWTVCVVAVVILLPVLFVGFVIGMDKITHRDLPVKISIQKARQATYNLSE